MLSVATGWRTDWKRRLEAVAQVRARVLLEQPPKNIY